MAYESGDRAEQQALLGSGDVRLVRFPTPVAVVSSSEGWTWFRPTAYLDKGKLFVTRADHVTKK